MFCARVNSRCSWRLRASSSLAARSLSGMPVAGARQEGFLGPDCMARLYFGEPKCTWICGGTLGAAPCAADSGNKNRHSAVLFFDETNHGRFFGETAMKEPIKGKSLRRLRRATLAIIASGIVAATSVHANPSNNIVLVSPTELPDSARQTGEAMLLRDTVDGRSLLYVVQNQGAQLTI